LGGVSHICIILFFLSGGLSLAVEGPSKAEISCHDNKDGTVSVSYLPTAPGEYKISVKFGDKHIKGSPYNAKITGTLNVLVL
jgi:filamin